ncbi:uncharacterized protein LOC130210112 [Pseudoliparis swirei]|uniref:uncharacterized protein LOC130210112 n=1 Tax=Pseudoliparis swirei TaxID=2059687 RepID=UPI0024BE50A1|nr:uncharacterized protein LOC130210112 [Pseudoliparis swirei]
MESAGGAPSRTPPTDSEKAGYSELLRRDRPSRSPGTAATRQRSAGGLRIPTPAWHLSAWASPGKDNVQPFPRSSVPEPSDIWYLQHQLWLARRCSTSLELVYAACDRLAQARCPPRRPVYIAPDLAGELPSWVQEGARVSLVQARWTRVTQDERQAAAGCRPPPMARRLSSPPETSSRTNALPPARPTVFELWDHAESPETKPGLHTWFQ